MTKKKDHLHKMTLGTNLVAAGAAADIGAVFIPLLMPWNESCSLFFSKTCDGFSEDWETLRGLFLFALGVVGPWLSFQFIELRERKEPIPTRLLLKVKGLMVVLALNSLLGFYCLSEGYWCQTDGDKFALALWDIISWFFEVLSAALFAVSACAYGAFLARAVTSDDP